MILFGHANAGIRRIEQRHRRVLVHHLLRIRPQRERIRPVVVIEILKLILDDQHAAVLDVVHQAAVGGFELRADRVGPRAEYDGVVAARSPCVISVAARIRTFTPRFVQRLRHVVAGAGKESDRQAGRGFDFHADGFVRRGTIERIRSQRPDIRSGGSPPYKNVLYNRRPR